MFKKIFFTIIGLAFFATSYQAYGFCGGEAVWNNDCANNTLPYTTSCCPDGYRVQGIVYNDLDGREDETNAIVAYCRKYKGPEEFYYNKDLLEGGKAPITLSCRPNEIMSALLQKDLEKRKDASDAFTIECTNPKTKVSYIVPNHDFDSNSRAPMVLRSELPYRIWGIGYKEERNRTDKVGCATIAVKNQPIVVGGR